MCLILILAASIGLVAVAGNNRAGAQQLSCVGDCDQNQSVTVDELLAMVNVALDADPVARCPQGDANQDGRITIDEILKAVNAALIGCPLQGASAVEAATGVESSTRDSVEMLDIIDFGPVGGGAGGSASRSTHMAARGAVVALPTECPNGGTFAISSCAVNQGVSVLTGTFSACRRVITQTRTVVVRNGKLRQTVADADFCGTTTLSSQVAVSVELSNFTFIITDASGETTARIVALTESFDPSGQGCAGPNGNKSVGGALDVVAKSGTDVSYTYRRFTLATESVIEPAGGPCQTRDTVNGTLDVDDRANRRSFSASLRDFAITSQQLDNTLSVSETGGLTVDCLGTVQFATPEPLRFTGQGSCPVAGMLEVMLPNAPSGSVQFTPNGLTFDFNRDGRPDKSLTSCLDRGLTQCSTPAAAENQDTIPAIPAPASLTAKTGAW